MGTTPADVDLEQVARGARLRALRYFGERPAHIFANAYSVSVSGGYDGEADITVQGRAGETEEARDYFGVTSEPDLAFHGSRWTHYVGRPSKGVRLVFVEDPA